MVKRWLDISIPGVAKMHQNKNVETTSKNSQEVIFQNAHLCGAKAKSTKKPCRAVVVKNKNRCRMHGGAEGSGAPKGNRNAFKHGFYTKEALMQRRQERQLMQKFNLLLQNC